MEDSTNQDSQLGQTNLLTREVSILKVQEEMAQKQLFEETKRQETFFAAGPSEMNNHQSNFFTSTGHCH